MSDSSSDEGETGGRSVSIHASPVSMALEAAGALSRQPSALSLASLSSGVNNGSGSSAPSSPRESRPSPQLRFALNSSGAVSPLLPPPPPAPAAPADGAPSSSSSSFAVDGGDFRTPPLHPRLARSSHSPHGAGSHPPSLSLESRALPATPPAVGRTRSSRANTNPDSLASPPFRARIRSLGGGEAAPHIDRLNIIPTTPLQARALALLRESERSSHSSPIQLAARPAQLPPALSIDGADEDAEDERLLSSDSRGSGSGGMRNRTQPSSGLSPALLPASLMAEPAEWRGTRRRALLLCASIVLGIMVFLFCSVIGLRFAAQLRYSTRECAPGARRPSVHSSSSPSTTGPDAWRTPPSYEWESWDQNEFETKGAEWVTAQRRAAGVTPQPTTEAELQSVRDEVASLWSAGAAYSALRLHHFKVLGTHNSYHQASDASQLVPGGLLAMHDYSHPPLAAQLESYRHGVRQVELDVHLTPGRASDGASGGLTVYHLQWLDDKTSCYCLSDCLSQVDAWSRAHPSHFPLLLTFEIKSQFYEDLDTGLRGVTCADVEAVEKEVVRTFGLERMILPSEVRGGGRHSGSSKAKNAQPKFASVKEALTDAAQAERAFKRRVREARQNNTPLPSPLDYPALSHGWPRLHDSLGRIMLLWLDDMHNLADKLDCVRGASLTGSGSDGSSSQSAVNPSWYHSADRVSFIAQNSMDKPYASIITQNKPQRAIRLGTIRHALHHGFLVRTMSVESSDLRADPTRFAAAVRSGAHIVSTDFEACAPRSGFHSADSSPGEGEDRGSIPDGLPPDMDRDLIEEMDPAPLAHLPVHVAAASPLSSEHPSQTSSTAQNVLPPNGTSVYCERLPSEWPFECNALTAPHFCESALRATHAMMEWRERSRPLFAVRNLFLRVHAEQKVSMAVELLQQAAAATQSLVFASSEQTCKALASALPPSLPAVDLCTRREFAESSSLYEQFRSGSARILLASDSASLNRSAIDVDRVGLVLQLDVPSSSDMYAQRAARSGPFGTPGVTLSLVATEEEQQRVRELERKFELQVKEISGVSELASLLP